jgi:predicted nucleic-acid-binding protein
MKITADTNVLVRAVVRDDAKQAQAAANALRQASLIAVSLPCLCEFVWVLRSVYGFEHAAIASAIRALMATEKVAMDRPAVEMGLAVLEAGGDFVDGIMAQQGQWLGAETFVSFDKKAVSLLSRLGQAAQMP